ncbi:ATP-binding protein, partial [Actinosynnema sp.]
NAYRHGGSPRPVRLERHGDRVRIEVDDASPHRLPVLSPPGTSTTKSGFGLVVVARLSEQWGVDQYNDHKTVWAELATA